MSVGARQPPREQGAVQHEGVPGEQRVPAGDVADAPESVPHGVRVDEELARRGLQGCLLYTSDAADE